MRRRRILVLSVSAGAGHARAAEALRETAQQRFEAVEALHLDVMDFVPAGFRKIYTDFYVKLVTRHPALWGMLYEATDDMPPTAPLAKLRRAVERLNTRALHQAIADFAPHAIVCTHFLPAEILMHQIRRGRLTLPVWVQVTDFDLHRMWIIPNMTGYFAASEEIAFRMRAAGIAPDAAHVTGIPIAPAFLASRDRAECAAGFGLDPHRDTFLLMGGGAGVGALADVAERLLALPGDFQLVVLAGRNVEALAALNTLAERHCGRVFPHGFTPGVPALMTCADLAITKPGGLTTSECLAMGLPMIVYSPIPGQEERNADYLIEQGAALKAHDVLALEFRVGQLQRSPALLAQMRERARALGRPRAAEDVLQVVLSQSAAVS